MFLNILRISASNVLKMFLNKIVSIGFAVVIFNSYKSTGSTNQPEVQTNRKYKPTGSTNQPRAQMRFIELPATLADKKEILY